MAIGDPPAPPEITIDVEDTVVELPDGSSADFGDESPIPEPANDP